MIIWSGKGLGIAIIAAVAGLIAIFVTPALGMAVKNAFGVGLITCGVVAFLLSRGEYSQGRPNTLFFIPVWLLGMACAGLGVAAIVGFLVIPKTAPETKAKLDQVEQALKDHPVSASHPGAEKHAERYRILLAAAAKAAGGGDKLNVYLDVDSDDPAKATTAALYIRVEDLKKYSKDAKRDLCSAALTLLAADFPMGRPRQPPARRRARHRRLERRSGLHSVIRIVGIVLGLSFARSPSSRR